MILRLWNRGSAPDDTAESRWQRFADAAARTEYYRIPDGWGGPVELAEVYQRPWRFLNPDFDRPAQDPALPWTAPVRALAIRPWFALNGGTATITHATPDRIRQFRPEALVAPLSVLRELGSWTESGTLELKLRFGVVALAGVGRPLLTQADRDRLWEAFGAPVFEQFRGFGGELLAAGCECHDGWHVRAEAAQFERLGDRVLLTDLGDLRVPIARLDTGIAADWADSCPCGRPGPILKPRVPVLS